VKIRYLKIAFVAVVLLTLIFSASFFGCKKEEAAAGGGMQVKTYTNAADITIGFSLWTMQFTFFQNLEKGVKDACADFGFKYIMIDQNSDATKMVQDMNALVGQKVSGIVSTPVDPGAIGPAVENARNNGIPVVCADIGKSGPVNALLISDNFKGSQLAAEFLDGKIKDPAKQLAVGNCLPQWTYARQRGEGFLSKALELTYNVGANIIVQNPSAEGGYDTMQQILSAVPDVSGVFFVSGREAVGAAQAIQAAGKDIWVVGYNGDPEEFQAIKDGILDATILQEPYYIGYRSVEILKEILMDGKFYENVEVPVDVKLVTPENMDQIAADILEKTGNSAFPAE